MGLGSFAAMTGLVLNPFGSAPDVLQAGKPWFAFEANGPVLHLIRVQKAPVRSCNAWMEALITVRADELAPIKAEDPGSLKRSWEPWSEKDVEPVKDCDDFPCKVKFDATEVEAMKKASPQDRFAKFLSLVSERVGLYEKTQVRKPYEIAGNPIDPWKLLEEKGFKLNSRRPETPVLYARKLNFAPDRMLTIHQILDRRVARTSQAGNATPSEAVVWIRDAYTDHYFDSWGEWSSVHCDAASGEAVVIQSMLSEMDLLKNTGIFARAFFGKYRSAFEDNGKIYLDEQFERLRKAAEKFSEPAKRPAAAH